MSLFSTLKSILTPAPSADPAACADRVRSGEAILVDVREPAEWSGGVAHSARLLPLSDLTGARAHWKTFLADVADREMLLYCASGGRSGVAARLLTAEGFRATNAGGLRNWIASGWPVARPSAARVRAR